MLHITEYLRASDDLWDTSCLRLTLILERHELLLSSALFMPVRTLEYKCDQCRHQKGRKMRGSEARPTSLLMNSVPEQFTQLVNYCYCYHYYSKLEQ